ncbi:MAG: trigger factor [Pseudomonadota bacterium]
MQVSVEVLEGLSRRLTVEVPQSTLKEAYDKRIKKIAKEVKLKGFRPGKVPMRVVEQRYGQSAWQEISGEAIQNSLYQALSENKLRPAVTPSIKELNADFGQAMKFVAEVEVLPEIKLQSLEGVEVETVTADLDEQDINEAIENLRQRNPLWHEVDRATQKEDRVQVTFTGFKDGKAVEQSAVEKMHLVLGQGRMPVEFEQALEGSKAGDEKEIAVDYPENHQNKLIAGQHIVFNVTIHKVEASELPEVNDVFVEKFDIKGGVEALKKEVEQGLRAQMNGLMKNVNKQQVINKFFEINQNIELPQGLIKSEVDNLRRANGKDDADVEDEAKKKVALGLIIGEYASKNNIQVKPARVRQLVEAMASNYPNPQELVAWYYADKKRLASLEWIALEEQVAEKLLESATPQEKKMSFAELKEQQ